MQRPIKRFVWYSYSRRLNSLAIKESCENKYPILADKIIFTKSRYIALCLSKYLQLLFWIWVQHDCNTRMKFNGIGDGDYISRFHNISFTKQKNSLFININIYYSYVEFSGKCIILWIPWSFPCLEKIVFSYRWQYWRFQLTILTVTAFSFRCTLSILDISFALKLPVTLATLERLSSTLKVTACTTVLYGKGFKTHESNDLTSGRVMCTEMITFSPIRLSTLSNFSFEI